MTLSGMQARHAAGIFANEDHHAEPVIYRFKSGDPDLAIRAVVVRLDLEASTPLSPQVVKRRATVEVARSATVGVLTVAKGDSIVLPMRIGETPVECRVRRIIKQDRGIWYLQVEE